MQAIFPKSRAALPVLISVLIECAITLQLLTDIPLNVWESLKPIIKVVGCEMVTCAPVKSLPGIVVKLGIVMPFDSISFAAILVGKMATAITEPIAVAIEIVNKSAILNFLNTNISSPEEKDVIN